MGSTAKWSGLRKEPCELEDRTTEMIHSEPQRENRLKSKNEESLSDLCHWVPEGEEKEGKTEEVLKK